MNISGYIKEYKNHPILFCGTGLSIRYLQNSFTWDNLLKKVIVDVCENEEIYYDIKNQYNKNGTPDYPMIAEKIEIFFDDLVKKDRNGKFKNINDMYYKNIGESGKSETCFKLYLCELLADCTLKEERGKEISSLKKARKNIASIVTTNYDCLIENLFEFSPIVGNNIIFSNPYGSVYKIHGCISDENSIIITNNDYEEFDDFHTLIRSQLISFFISNPIIFLGYEINDINIKKLLEAIFIHIDPNSEEAQRIKQNFLLVEYDQGSDNEEIEEHSIVLEKTTIRINKIRTDNFESIYTELSKLHLPVSVMDIRKVKQIVKTIEDSGDIKVNITEDIDNLENSDKILAIGSKNSVSYEFISAKELIKDYFKIISDDNYAKLQVVDKIKIQSQQYFPIHKFSEINSDLSKSNILKEQQIKKLESYFSGIKWNNMEDYFVNQKKITDIKDDQNISRTKKQEYIFYGVYKNIFEKEDIEKYLKNYEDSSYYKRILCAYDFIY